MTKKRTSLEIQEMLYSDFVSKAKEALNQEEISRNDILECLEMLVTSTMVVFFESEDHLSATKTFGKNVQNMLDAHNAKNE